MNIAYRFRIYPTEEQKIFLGKTFGCCRFLYNQMLNDKIREYEKTKKMLKNTPAMYKKEYPFLKEVDSLALANKNIRDMFRLMTEFEFDFIINSQVLWGDCDTLDALAIYQLIRPENAKFVTVMPYLWNGKKKRTAGR